MWDMAMQSSQTSLIRRCSGAAVRKIVALPNAFRQRHDSLDRSGRAPLDAKQAKDGAPLFGLKRTQ